MLFFLLALVEALPDIDGTKAIIWQQSYNYVNGYTSSASMITEASEKTDFLWSLPCPFPTLRPAVSPVVVTLCHLVPSHLPPQACGVRCHQDLGGASRP